MVTNKKAPDPKIEGFRVLSMMTFEVLNSLFTFAKRITDNFWVGAGIATVGVSVK